MEEIVPRWQGIQLQHFTEILPLHRLHKNLAVV
jgi:hypothetical protein